MPPIKIVRKQAPQQQPTPQPPPLPPQPPPQYYPPQPPQQPPPQQYYPPPPPQATYYSAPPPQPKPKHKGGCRGCLTSLLLLLLVLVGLVGGVYLLWSQGIITERMIATLGGQGVGEISVANFSDEEVRVEPIALDEEQGTLLENDLKLAPNDIDGYMFKEGRYQLDFDYYTSQTTLTCIIYLDVNAVYQFVVVNEGIVITKEGYEPSALSEYSVSLSSLCKK